jgi:hypothetical protein
VGDDKEQRPKGFLPDFRDAIKAAWSPNEGNQVSARQRGKAESGEIL